MNRGTRVRTLVDLGNLWTGFVPKGSLGTITIGVVKEDGAIAVKLDNAEGCLDTTIPIVFLETVEEHRRKSSYGYG